MLELANPFEGEGGVVRLLEDPDGDRDHLRESLLAGTYDKPFVIEDDGARCLYFTRAFIQTEMRLADPTALEFAYTRAMMAFLLFVPDPRSILMLGLGGGSLAKFCHRQLPRARITAVEIDPHVVAFREQFLLPADGDRFRVVLGDAIAHVAQEESRHDVVMLDAFDPQGVAPTLCNREFYADVRNGLDRRGLLVANLVGEKSERGAHLAMIRKAFGDNVLLLPLPDDGNHVVFAFRDAAFEPRWRWIAGQARAMGARHGLDLAGFAMKLERSRRQGLARRGLDEAPEPGRRRIL